MLVTLIDDRWAVPKHEAVVSVDLPDSVISTLSTPNTEVRMPLNCNGGRKFITVLNVGPGVGTYGVTPAHVAFHKRDNAVPFAFWRSEPNRILRVLKRRPSLEVPFIDCALPV